MARYRSILSWILALLTVFVVSCGSPTAAKPPTYTPAQLEQIEQTASKIQAMRDRLSELATLITSRKWVDVGTFIHGPLGTLRQEMAYLSSNLLKKDQKAARETAKNVFGHLELIDKASQEGDYVVAVQNYAEAVKDFDAFLNLIPQG